MLRLSEAAIISTTIQGMLYGIAVIMFLLTTFILIRDHRRRGINYGMLAVATSLILLATAEFTVNVVRIVRGFIVDASTSPAELEGFFADVTQITFIVKGALYNLQTLILDGVVIYRVWVVWQKWWIMILPSLGWLALLASTVGLNRAFITVSSSSSPDEVFATDLGKWVVATYTTTLITNLLSTSVLAYRIWSVNRRASVFVAYKRLTPILIVILESGAIYSVTVAAALIAFLVNSVGSFIILDLISPIISIVFNMIIVRIGFSADRGFSVFPVESVTTSPTSIPGPILSTNEGSAVSRRNTQVAIAVDVELTKYYDGGRPESLKTRSETNLASSVRSSRRLGLDDRSRDHF
ncbi:hypothetical protein BXZ70DRAFT_657789 [Cristinia sonorae]|uniref:Uncharacterized protein n=1 Tax=Cristinia sonorae TaxID=1940300 RepID=A0A8K0XK37_9AGAR|nr:hypothetical protein BXZ70DRAFT_657789 [Cristinia sonorae]